MNLPKTDFHVKVAGLTYEVVYSDDVSTEGNCFGSTHNNTQKIFLQRNSIKQQKLDQTFIHELLHAASFISGLCYRYEKDPKPTEEDVVRELSTVLHQVLMDNKELFR